MCVHITLIATDEEYTALTVLFDKSLIKAARLVDEGQVRQIIGKDSGRVLWRVGKRGTSSGGGNNNGGNGMYATGVGGGPGGGTGGTTRENYIVLQNFCSCQSFFYDVIGKETALRCKHQLAVDLARALGRHSVVHLPDIDLAKLLMTL